MNVAQLVQSCVQSGELWIADPDGDDVINRARAWATSDSELIILVGPEGGFTDIEQRSVRDVGGHPVALGHNILRVETAAAAVLACTAAVI
jgi:16S rRNA (uracil1498-N3)-methyltransferase